MLSRNRFSNAWASAILIAAIASLSLASGAQAALVIVAPTFTAAAGSSGSFDVVVNNTAGSPSFSVASDSVQLAISGAGVQFTSATIATSTPYIYSSSFDANFGLPLDGTGVSFPKTSLTASDVADNPSSRTIAAGNSFGLVHVSYTVAAGALAGPRQLTIQDIGGGTSLTDGNGNAVAFTAVNGLLTVVPEPGSLSLLAAGSAWVLLARRSRRAAAGRAD